MNINSVFSTLAASTRALILISLPWANAAASDRVDAMYFAAGWRSSSSPAQNIVQLGVVFRCGKDWCLERETFEGAKNLGFTPLAAHHQMRAPRRSPSCVEGPINTISGRVDRIRAVRLSEGPDGWIVETDDLRYEWRKASAATRPDVRLELNSLATGRDRTALDQVVGIGYMATGSAALADLTQMKHRYDGEISHKDMNASVSDPWEQKRSVIDFRSYIPTDADGKVLTLTQEGHRDVVKRLGKALWVENAIAIAPARASRLGYVVHEYGHDFNGNGCFDEPGHNKLLLPVLNAGVVVALPYIEYTPDRKDGVPMLSVGSYYLRPGSQPAK